MASSTYGALKSSASATPRVSEEGVDFLTRVAREASAQAYCPYSHFQVGAAVMTEDGDIFGGCNVENVSYGLTICAERSAIFQAIAKGKRRIKALLIYTPTLKPTSPCGACRQVLAEFGVDAEVIAVCDGDELMRVDFKTLFPFPFQPSWGAVR